MIKTKIWHVDRQSNTNSTNQEQNKKLYSELIEGAEMLRSGGLVAFPTETVYGLGADARNSEAVAGIFEAKGRPSDNPLIVHIADINQLGELVLPYPQLAKELMNRFWPGPLTIVLPVQPDKLSPLVTAGLSTVGIRMPDHSVSLELLRLSECPVAAPSANRSGRPSPTLAQHVLDDLDGRIDGIVDGGPTGVGLESTVVELEDERTLRILRPGGITEEALIEAFPDVCIVKEHVNDEMVEKPRSPGMKYTHYAPKGELSIVQGDSLNVIVYINKQLEIAKSENKLTGVLAFSEHVSEYKADRVIDCGSEKRLDEAAQRLYAALREFDEAGVQFMWAEACKTEGIGGALMNRLVKAAGHQIIYV
ncbi:threonylcarbamoyl-AMP synthase [Paenibacillus sp. GSMTC-2017]|uniref:L-threonylcarbamoyladenylate synthase n=1 Tax=Paenibacillus sp. GSMTC-2017 TaxID=2794350 RepID=UPI0018D6E1B9|nr:L-threonylcarbamoyladenylate synthase [Paenibacillus sp. GSMTC-2017]MBH5320545.1 threonylcarbamoyl-AMP synthase [Paenibacillus sp. GSMTC-2017]